MYKVYVIADKGDGRVQEIGRFENGENFEIQAGILSPDVVIAIDWEKDKEEDEGV